MFNQLNLNGIPNRQTDTLEDKQLLMNEQAQFVIKQLSQCYDNVEWYITSEFIGDNNPRINLILGDCIGIRMNKPNKKPDIFIYLKVSKYGANTKYLDNLTLDTIIDFQYKQKNHYYLLVNSDGLDWIIICCSDIYNLLMNKTTKCLLESKYRKYINTKYDRFIDRFIYPKQYDNICGKDYIPGSFLRRYDRHIK